MKKLSVAQKHMMMTLFRLRRRHITTRRLRAGEVRTGRSLVRRGLAKESELHIKLTESGVRWCESYIAEGLRETLDRFATKIAALATETGEPGSYDAAVRVCQELSDGLWLLLVKS